MSGNISNTDQFAVSFSKWIIKYRWPVIILAILATVAIGSGAKKLEFSNNYRVFFSKENPELNAFEKLQNTYTKNDNFLFVLKPKSGKTFSQSTLSAIEEMTQDAWQIPYVIRVDSLSNFQSTKGVGDDLIVEDLVNNSNSLSNSQLQEKQRIALNEPLLLNQLITEDASVGAINVVVQYPEKSLEEVPQAAAVARQLRDKIEANHPDLEVILTGVSMLNNAFSEAGMKDSSTLVPIMFGIILLMTFLILRSISSTFATLIVIILSCTVGMGMAGFFGIKLTPVSASAPIVILTLAIADSIHILVSFRTAMQEGMQKLDAIIEAIRLNFLPVTVTSITTIIGFLALNFSDSPPFWHLGNITAMGIAAAWVLSLALLPALVSLLPIKIKQTKQTPLSQRLMEKLANFAINQRKVLFPSIGIVSLILIAFIPTIQFNDQWVEYFSENIEFRTESDEALKYFGMYPIEFSVTAKDAGGVSEPEYLAKLDEFAEFLRQQPQVKHVYSLSDIMKRLNKNLHSDQENYYRIPSDRELSAQYLLLYELSLPYGLDLNDRINVDKSASRVTATLHNISTSETKAFLNKVNSWTAENLHDYMQAQPTSAQVMFTYITERNVNNMISGTIIAIIAIAFIMMLSLRSLSLGALSLIPNALPILTTFGAWALLIGTVGFSVATVTSISLGIIVDDTVHFLSKYLRARREKALEAADSIRYAFKSVGTAIVVNTVILASGFLVLLTSNFKVNADMGLLTAMAIVFALILDFLFLPALLMLLDKKKQNPAAESLDSMTSNVA